MTRRISAVSGLRANRRYLDSREDAKARRMETIVNFVFILLSVLTLAGCNNHLENAMPASFQPPGIRSLADIDVADAAYGKESVVIQGVVSPSSQGGWPGKNDGYEVHCFSFAAWHRLGEPPTKRHLTILRPVPPDANYFGEFPTCSLQRMRVLLSSDETRAIFEKTLPMDAPDDQLQSIAAELEKPVTFSTDRFGKLVLDRRIDWFEGKADWNGELIRVTFPVDDEQPDANALKDAEALWSEQAKWKELVEQYAVKELLELKNGTWLEEDESEITAEQFIATMTLKTISIESDGEFEFWYDDADLFWGHSIAVRGNLKDGPTDAGIHG